MAKMFEPLAAFADSTRQGHPETEYDAQHSDWMRFDGAPTGFVADRRYGPSDRRTAGPPVAAAGEEHAAALANAHAEGEIAGRASAIEEFAMEKALWGKLKLELTQLDEQTQELLAQGLRETVAALCERTLEPLALDTELLARRCGIAAQMIGDAAGALTLHIHPDDYASLDPEFPKRLSVATDPELERGSLRFASADGDVISGPAQWRAAIADAIGLD